RVRKFTTHQAAASSCAHGENDRSMRWIHGEIPFVSSRRERFTREGTSPSQGKEPSGCTSKGFLSYHGHGAFDVRMRKPLLDRPQINSGPLRPHSKGSAECQSTCRRKHSPASP